MGQVLQMLYEQYLITGVPTSLECSDITNSKMAVQGNFADSYFCFKTRKMTKHSSVQMISPSPVQGETLPLGVLLGCFRANKWVRLN